MHRNNYQAHLSRRHWFRLGLTTLFMVTLSAICGFNVQADQEPLNVPNQAAEAPQVTVAAIMENPSDEMAVTLQGKILRPGNDAGEYVFSDGTGEIVLESQDENFRFPANTLIKVSGEVNLEADEEVQQEAHPEAVEIDVYDFQIIEP